MFCSVKYHPKWAYLRSAGREIFEEPPDLVLLRCLLDLLTDLHGSGVNERKNRQRKDRDETEKSGSNPRSFHLPVSSRTTRRPTCGPRSASRSYYSADLKPVSNLHLSPYLCAVTPGSTNPCASRFRVPRIRGNDARHLWPCSRVSIVGSRA